AWLLTAITGPDFIDKNGDNYANEGDAGSWTTFNYGKYTNSYLTRTPYTAKKKENDGASSYAGAYMEVYYLDAISTRTHTALFSKSSDVREDGRSAFNLPRGGCDPSTSLYSLKLQDVLLYSNQKLLSMGGGASSIYQAITNIKSAGSSGLAGLFDNYDLMNVDNNYNNPALTSNCIQHVNLQTDYSLAVSTPDNSIAGDGKLTLKSVKFYGANASKLKPSVSFGYELPVQNSDNITGFPIPPTTSAPRSATMATSSGNFNVGDIISFSLTHLGSSYPAYASIKSKNGTSYNISFLGSTIPPNGDLPASGASISA